MADTSESSESLIARLRNELADARVALQESEAALRDYRRMYRAAVLEDIATEDSRD